MKWSRPQRLEIRELLGHGWSGDVYVAQAMHGPLDAPEQVAVRLVDPALVPEIGRLLHLLQPGATLGLSHVLPTTLPEAFDGQLFYAMPLADQGSLRSVLGRVAATGTHLDPLTALDITRQVGEALESAHEHGALHGNLKPENVLLWARPPEGFEVQLSDFGLNLLRSPDAASPYLSAEGRVGAPTSVQDDLYSLGALLFEMLSGRPLPLDPQAMDLQGLPEAVRKLLSRCFGWPVAFSDVSAFLGQLRAVRAVIETSLSSSGLQLLLDPPVLSVTPGQVHSVQVRLSSNQDASVLLVAEGWPEGWVRLPTPPALPVRAGSETVTSVEVLVPRDPGTAPETFEGSLLALALHSGGERELLARTPLHLNLLPFEATRLTLQPAQRSGRDAALHLTLSNEGNQPQPYRLDVTVPPGTRVRGGTLGKQFELAPGAEYHDTLDLRLPLALLGRRENLIAAVAHTRPLDVTTWPPPESSVQASVTLDQPPALPWWGLALLALALVGGTLWAAQPPSIEQFAVQGAAPARGQPFTLAWQTTGARRVHLVELPGVRLAAQGARQLPGLSAEQTYTLVAQGWLTRRSRQVTVRPVAPLPRIVTFQVSPPSAKVGQLVTVRWAVEQAARVTLTPFGAVPGSGSRQVRLSRDQQFTLRAQQGQTPSAADVVSTLSAAVGSPQIQRFSITPSSVQRGQSVTLRWQVSGAAQVRLAPLGTLPAAGTRVLTPQQTTNYTLKASNGQQEVLKSQQVTVTARPVRIDRFTVSSLRPRTGQPLTLTWATSGAERVTLRWGDQQQVVPASGQITLSTTAQMAHLTLVAQGSGDPVLRTLDLAIVPATSGQGAPPAVVLTPPASAPATGTATSSAPTGTAPAPTAPPRITRLSASPRQVVVGGRTTLSWTATGRGSLTLIGPDTRIIGRYPARGSASVVVRATGPQTYRLVSGDQVMRVTVQGQARPAAGQGAAPAGTASGSANRPRPGQGTAAMPASGFGQTSTGAGVAVPAPSSSAAPAAAPAVQVEVFRARPAALRPGQSAALSWQVSGASKVYLRGFRGPNADGSFPPIGSVTTPAATATQVFVLGAGGTRTSLRVPLLSGARRPNSAASAPQPSPANSPYLPLAGDWQHPFGTLRLNLDGDRVSGTLSSSQADLPSGSFSGRLSGDRDSPVLNAFVGEGQSRVALLVRFDTAAQTFTGFYATRGNRERWCGWRGDNIQDCQ